MNRKSLALLSGMATCFALWVQALLPISVRAQDPPTAPPTFNDGFEAGYLFFDDGVGVLHVRQSGSTAETDYAPGIPASKGRFYARLLVQPWLQNDGASPCPIGGSGPNCGINGSQAPAPLCMPGAAESNNSFSCGGPFTEWGLPFGGFDGKFDTGIPIKGNGSMTSIDIYLDTAFAVTPRSSSGAVDYRFDWDSDLLDSQGNFLQDYIFNAATGQSSDSCAPTGTGGFYVIEASTNSQRSGANAHNPTPPNPPQVCISKSGWYTFQHTFRPDSSNNLEVDMVILDSSHHIVASWALHPTCMGTQVTNGLCANAAPLPFSAVGANFLGWFPDQEINKLAADNVLRKPSDQDEGEGKDNDGDEAKFNDSPSYPESSNMSYSDASQGMNLQSVNGARSITYNGACVSFVADALRNGNPGYVVTFAACDLSALGTGIGNFSISVAGPLGFLYQKSATLTSGYVSIRPH
jgi:hypothetical protein